MDKVAHIIVQGRVQGVGFRWFVQEVAEKMYLVGDVKNLPDRSVEIHVAGSEEDVELFLARLRKGNHYSRVDKVQVDWEQSDDNWTTFKILR